MSEQEKIISEMFEKGILISQDILEKKITHEIIDKIQPEEDLLVINSDYTEIVTKQTSLVDWYEIDKNRVEAEKHRDDELYQTQLQHFKHSTLVFDLPKFTQTQQISSLETELDKTEVGEIKLDGTRLNETNLHFEEFLPPSSQLLSSEDSALLSNPQLNTELNSELNPSLLQIGSVTIIVSYQNIPHKYEIKDFTNFFISRYRFLEKILRSRQEMQDVLPISRLLAKKEKEKVALIGVIEEINTTKNDNLIISVEDLTGKISLIISKSKKELFALGKDLVVDEVIGVMGTCGDKIIFAENIIFPDLPSDRELKKNDSLEEPEYALFLSDLHIGSTLFLKEEFEKFLRWINGKAGNELQRETARRVKYIIIAGDLVDGIGVYPSQEEELAIKDIIEQYAEVSRLLSLIPPDKQIIACPGNHDLVHLAEPQPVFYKEYCSELLKLPNLILVSNPAFINIGKTKNFFGFDILMYHGYSFDYYVANVESIRNGGGYHRADLIMKFLLQKRHLAPSFKSTPYYPGYTEDPLLIKKIPDFFITGHIHYSNVANYKGVTMISGSCWQAKTSFQEKMGHEPEPGRIPLVNLKTREIKLLRFVDKEEKVEEKKTEENKPAEESKKQEEIKKLEDKVESKIESKATGES